jgi:hypothetical protein
MSRVIPDWVPELARSNELPVNLVEKAYNTAHAIMNNLADSDFVTRHGRQAVETLSNSVDGYLRDIVLDIAVGMQ